MRLFAALDLPGDVRVALAGWAASAVGEDDRLRLVRAESLHLTLVFVGERADPAPVCAAVVGALQPAPRAPELSVSGPLWLSPRRPHVLTVALDDPSGSVERIQAAVLEALIREAGHPAERRAFRPHVTVARIRGRLRPYELPDPPSLAFTAASVTLYRSVLGRGPATYEPVVSVPLSTLS